MSDEENQGLAKVFVHLPNHWATGGESVWAKGLGNDEYELRNTPFYAYGLNWGDVVLTITPDPEQIPQVQKVLRPSGNRTLRIFFAKDMNRESQVEQLDRLKAYGLSYERATETLIALDVDSNSDYDTICNELWNLEQLGILEYETCEPRAEGRFDDGPEEHDTIETNEYEN